MTQKPIPGLTRDDPRFWDNVPEDYNAKGLYREGPQEATPLTHRIAGSGSELAEASGVEASARVAQLNAEAADSLVDACKGDLAKAWELAQLRNHELPKPRRLHLTELHAALSRYRARQAPKTVSGARRLLEAVKGAVGRNRRQRPPGA